MFLYGTLITDDASYAFIEDKKAPYSTPGRGKRQVTLKKGDHLSGYTLSEIEANRIVLVKGEDKVVVTLDESEKKRTGEVPAMPATARTATGGISALLAYRSFITPGNATLAAGGSFTRTGDCVSRLTRPSPRPVSSPGPGMGGPDSRPTTRRGMIEAVKELKTQTHTTDSPRVKSVLTMR